MKLALATIATIAATTTFGAAQEANWNKVYSGFSFTTNSLDVTQNNLGLTASDTGYGFFFGAQQQIDKAVIGAELTYDEAGGIDVVRARLRAGFDAGVVLPYVNLGVAAVAIDGYSDSGLTYGVGIDFKVTDKVTIGAEYSTISLPDAYGNVYDVDVGIDSFAIRTSFAF